MEVGRRRAGQADFTLTGRMGGGMRSWMQKKVARFPMSFALGARWTRVVIWTVGVYVAMLAFLLACEDRLAFAGWTFRKAWVGPPAGTVVEDARVATPDGNTIEAWWLPPAEWTPAQGALLYMHGNGENLSNCGHALKKWRDELKTECSALIIPAMATARAHRVSRVVMPRRRRLWIGSCGKRKWRRRAYAGWAIARGRDGDRAGLPSTLPDGRDFGRVHVVSGDCAAPVLLDSRVLPRASAVR